MTQVMQVTVDDLKKLLRLKDQLPSDLYPILDNRDGATKLAAELPKRFTPESIMDGLPNQNTWTSTAAFYFNQGRYTEALLFYKALYDHMLLAESKMNSRYHKGTPLVYMSDTYAQLGYSLISRRYLMLTLIEDAIRESGKISPDTTGIYFRVVWGGALSDSQLKLYAEKIYELSQANEEDARYPEWVLQQLDQSWITQAPAPQEVGVYTVNPRYIRKLLSQLSDGTGKKLELLADYVLSCMPDVARRGACSHHQQIWMWFVQWKGLT